MVVTERTPLTRSTDAPNYAESYNVLRPRRIRVSQFQCCVWATFTAILAMALVATVGYLARTTTTTTTTTTRTDLRARDGAEPVLAATLVEASRATGLTDDERQEGLLAGLRAMDDRRIADARATPLPAIPSPNSRHRHAVKTSAFAGQLALAGVGEIAATRKIEGKRNRLGKVSSVGIYFDAGWVPAGGCKEYSKLDCSAASKYRTFDGSCNHPRQRGSALSAFRRALPPDYADGVDAPRRGRFGRDLPSAREVSLRVHPPSPSTNPSFTVMLAVFGQFLDHDVSATAISQGSGGSSLSCCPPSTGHPECFPVYAGSSCMEFVRSAPAPQCKIGPRQQLNQVSAFVDGSAIYGPDSSTARNLREGKAGRLKMQVTPDNRTLLPPSTDPNDGCNRELENARGRYCFVAGDGRANENLHLTTMHLLWARQHNGIAASLASVNPSWEDERLYQEARRVVIAQLQHIAYREFVPIVLGERETSRRRLKPLRSGYRRDPIAYDTRIDPAIGNNFAAAAFRFAHTLLPGLMRVTDATKGTSSYLELGKMLFNPYGLYDRGGVASSMIAAASNLVQATTTHVTSQLTRHLFEDPVANATPPPRCGGLDLVSLNVQRGRDHGLPSYAAWREYCALTRPTNFSELAPHLDPEALEQISELYASVEDVDLYTGALAETVASDGILGPTFTCLIADQFARLQRGDRYWYETAEGPQAFTDEQLHELRKSSLAKLICDRSDQVTRIQPEVMRSVSRDNPTLPCNDIPGPSMAAWRDNHLSPVEPTQS